MPNEHLTPDELAIMEEKYAAGWPIADIAAFMGRQYTTVSRRVKRKRETGERLAARPWRCGECGGLTKTQQCQVCKVRRLSGVTNAETIRDIRRKTKQQNLKRNGRIRTPAISARRGAYRVG